MKSTRAPMGPSKQDPTESARAPRQYPSGAAKRARAKQQADAELRAHAEKIARGEAIPTFTVPDKPDMSEIHLRQLEQLWQAQKMILEDETLPIPARVKVILNTSHAMAKINTQAQQEADLAEYKARVVKKEDELREAKAATLRERHLLQQERQALKQERERLASGVQS